MSVSPNDLQSYFDKYATNIRQSFNRFEERYARPIVDSCISSSRVRPVMSLFVATFALLSILPILSFIGFSLLSVVSFTLIALFCVCLASTIAIFVFAVTLITTLINLFFVSALITLGSIIAYLAARLFILMRAQGKQGISMWIVETRSRFLTSSSQPLPNYETVTDKGPVGDGIEQVKMPVEEDYEGTSDTSAVVVVKPEQEDGNSHVSSTVQIGYTQALPTIFGIFEGEREKADPPEGDGKVEVE